jgi:hypothetical protein
MEGREIVGSSVVDMLATTGGLRMGPELGCCDVGLAVEMWRSLRYMLRR